MSETVKLTYQGPAPVIVPDAGIVAEPGQSYEIATELAASLLGRPSWVKAEKKAEKESEQ